MNDLLARLNALRRGGDDADAFSVGNDGVLRAFVDRTWRASLSILGLVREATAMHIRGYRAANPGVRRVSTGLEIGAGVAKLLAKAWSRDPNGRITGETIADVKLELTKLKEMKDAARDYPNEVAPIVQALGAFGWTVPPENFNLADPRKLLNGCPLSADFTYVYGTQGPRDMRKLLGASPIPQMRVLSGDEEALLIFDSIVPDTYAKRPGTMVVEIGSGSTEVVLVDHASLKRAVTFAIGGASDAHLTDVVKAIEANDVARTVEILESDRSDAGAFLNEARSLRAAPRMMFVNPNREGAKLRAQIRRASGELDAAAALRCGREGGGETAAKARILGSLAQAFGFDVIHEGQKGGLKEGLAKFVAAALNDLTTQQGDQP